MGSAVIIFNLLLITAIVSSSPTQERLPKKDGQKSRLILEYDWPQPTKKLNRLPHPRSCHHFIYTKHDGSHGVKRCHRGKIFDYRSLRCHEESSAKCWRNIVAKRGNMKISKRRFSCPFPWGLYPNKGDCSFFYECMGGKVYSRKCPGSTLFDAVEKICVHSRKALCANDADISLRELTSSFSPVLSEGANNKESSIVKERNLTTKINDLSKSVGKILLKSKENNPEEENSSEDVNKRYHTRSKTKSNKYDSEENSSEEVSKKYRTRSKNKYTTNKSAFTSTSISYPKSFRTKDDESEEDSSEEIHEKQRTKSKNKSTIPNLLFPSTTTMNIKSLRTTDTNSKEDISDEENSSEEKDSKFRTKYNLKSTTAKIPISSVSLFSTEISPEVHVSTRVTTEKDNTPSNSQVDYSSAISFQDSTIKPFSSTESTLKPDLKTAAPDANGNDDNKTVPTEKMFTEPSESSSDMKAYSSTETPFISVSSTFGSKTTLNSDNESKSTIVTPEILCPDSSGYFPHPQNRHKFVACIGGKPTVMECPEKLVYDSKSASCVYDVI